MRPALFPMVCSDFQGPAWRDIRLDAWWWYKTRGLYPRANATNPAALLGFNLGAGVHAVDPLLEDGGRLEHHDAARRDRDFLAGLRITPDTLALLAYHERSE